MIDLNDERFAVKYGRIAVCGYWKDIKPSVAHITLFMCVMQ